jgi:hypothetical protein
LEPPERLPELRDRVLGARDALRAMPAGLPERQGPPDPETGERWTGRNVLGHVAEMLPFWVSGLRAGLRGGEFGRDEAGSARRREAIDAALTESERALRLRVDRGCAKLLALLARLDERDLERRVRDRRRGELRVADALELLLVGHLEEHVEQLRSVTSAEER